MTMPDERGTKMAIRWDDRGQAGGQLRSDGETGQRLAGAVLLSPFYLRLAGREINPTSRGRCRR